MAKFFRNKWFLLFLLIPFFKPVCLQYYSKLLFVDMIFVIWKIAAAVIAVIALSLYVCKNSGIPKLIVLVTLFESAVFLSTVLHKGAVEDAVIDAISVISFCTILIMGIRYQANKMIHALAVLMQTLVLVNLCSMILFPDGLRADLYRNNVNALFFMVVDNGSALFLAFSALVFIIDTFVNKGYFSFKHKGFLAACILSSILSKSATAILSVAVLLILSIILMKSEVKKFINPKNLILIYCVLFVSLMTMQENLVTRLILHYVFNRSSNFSGRYVLWEQAFELIKREPLLGYGRMANDYIQAWGGRFSSHNYILEILLQGGIVALAAFVKVLLAALKRAHGKKLSQYAAVILWIMLIAAMMESTVHSVYIFGAVCFCYYSRQFEQKQV